MNNYCCQKCDMKIKAPICGKCNKELKLKSIEHQGRKVQVSQCPSGCGKIKSPECCGQDMALEKQAA